MFEKIKLCLLLFCIIIPSPFGVVVDEAVPFLYILYFFACPRYGHSHRTIDDVTVFVREEVES